MPDESLEFELLMDQYASEVAGGYLSMLDSEARTRFKVLPICTARRLQSLAMCRVIMGLNHPNRLLRRDEKENASLTEEYDSFAIVARGLMEAIVDRLLNWESGDGPDELEEAVIDAL